MKTRVTIVVDQPPGRVGVAELQDALVGVEVHSAIEGEWIATIVEATVVERVPE